MREFHSNPRLVQHLRNSPTRRESWERSGFLPSEEELGQARVEYKQVTAFSRAKARPDHYAERPPL
eukprot:4885353-Pyramimonas_sp.AAC.1